VLNLNIPRFDSPEEEIKKWLNYIAVICLSEEFQSLKKELESIYLRSNMEDVQLTAFQDALYAFLSQEVDEQVYLSNAN